MQETCWYIAVVTPNTERACEKKLIEMFNNDTSVDFDTYVPYQRELHEWPSTGKRKWVDRVLCPCYLFIRCSKEMRYTISCNAPFILHFVMDRARQNQFGKPDFAMIPSSQMLSFQRMIGDAEMPVTIDSSRLRVGAKVRVKGGKLIGLEGNVLREPGTKTSIVLNIDFLGCAKTEVPLELLELVE